MNIEEYLDYMKEIQNKLEEFIDDDNNSNANLPNLLDLINDKKNRITSQQLKTFFYIIVKIANNHKRCPNFYNKIESVLSNFKEDIKKYSNFEVFQIFSGNKRILLFLIKEELLHLDEEIAQIIIRRKFNSNAINKIQNDSVFEKIFNDFYRNQNLWNHEVLWEDITVFHAAIKTNISTIVISCCNQNQ